MEKKEFSAYDVAREAGLTHPTIYAWLERRGKRPPKVENVEAVAKALGVTYGELWGSDGLAPSERTRLVQLERFASRVEELLKEIRTGAASEVPAPRELQGPPPPPGSRRHA